MFFKRREISRRAERLLGSQEVPYSTLYAKLTFSRTDSMYHVFMKEFCYTCWPVLCSINFFGGEGARGRCSNSVPTLIPSQPTPTFSLSLVRALVLVKRSLFMEWQGTGEKRSVWEGTAAQDLEDYLQCQVSQFFTIIVQFWMSGGSFKWLAETPRALSRWPTLQL
jgi:hypothetical protein